MCLNNKQNILDLEIRNEKPTEYKQQRAWHCPHLLQKSLFEPNQIFINN